MKYGFQKVVVWNLNFIECRFWVSSRLPAAQSRILLYAFCKKFRYSSDASKVIERPSNFKSDNDPFAGDGWAGQISE